ncbi:MAG: hypothetical protein H0T84_08185 [Tatlockia sp.]|nr:hypothetical protein [Tatlockia sp.]
MKKSKLKFAIFSFLLSCSDLLFSTTCPDPGDVNSSKINSQTRNEVPFSDLFIPLKVDGNLPNNFSANKFTSAVINKDLLNCNYDITLYTGSGTQVTSGKLTLVAQSRSGWDATSNVWIGAFFKTCLYSLMRCSFRPAP